MQQLVFFSIFDLLCRFKCCLCAGLDVFVRVVVANFCHVGGLIWFVVLGAYLCIFKSEMNH